MPDTGFIALFLIGLLGGTHCVGMCGGIVTALSLGGRVNWSVLLAYNLGRIASYALAGAVVGALGGASVVLANQLPVRIALYLLASLMLLAMGAYLLGVTRALNWLEQAGQGLWQHLQPLTRRFLPAETAAQAFPLGLIWGWLPCGLVYSALATALTTGSAARGALSMLAFGLGTLPNLLLAGVLLGRLNAWVKQTWVRRLAGGLVLAFGLYGLLGVYRLLIQL